MKSFVEVCRLIFSYLTPSIDYIFFFSCFLKQEIYHILKIILEDITADETEYRNIGLVCQENMLARSIKNGG